MLKLSNRAFRLAMLLAGAGFAARAATVSAQSNISPVNKWSWGENVGWTNWYDDGVSSGAIVNDFVLEGFIWSENTGWLFLGDGMPLVGDYYGNAVAGDTGVNIAPNGDLLGFAWGENIGWVNFDTVLAAGPDRARIEMCCPAGQFSGYAWGENVGWINLDSAVAFVGLAPGVARARGDVNGDGLRNGLDIQGFVDTVLAPGAASPAEFCAADMNGDGVVTFADVPGFVTCLLTGMCVCP